MLVLVLVCCNCVSAQSLSRGHRILLDRGLQISGLAFVIETGSFNASRWAESNFTSINHWGPYQPTTYPTALMPEAPGIPWCRASYVPEYPYIEPGEEPYLPSLYRIQLKDEQDVTDPVEANDLAAAVATYHSLLPDVIVHTNQGTPLAVEEMREYMQFVQPDMLMFDNYAFGWDSTAPDPYPGGSPTHLYEYMERYRKLGLEGNDGTGSLPIPTGLWIRTFYSETPYGDHIVSESEIRVQYFASWAFGYKLIDCFVYESPPHYPGLLTIMFDGLGYDSDNPTPQFYQVAETNRQSLNLGSALTRLISTDVRMLMGRHIDGTATQNDQPEGVLAWDSSADPYITEISAENLGSKNSGLEGDVIVGYFKPLHPAFTNPGYENDIYFMVVNALSDFDGSAAETQQRIRLTFDFGASGIDSLLRLSRETGLVEEVNLVSEGGSFYHLDLILDGGTGDLFKFNNGGAFAKDTTEDFENYVPPAILQALWEDAASELQNQITGQVKNVAGGTDSSDVEAIGEGWDWSRAWKPLANQNRVRAQLYLGNYTHAETAIGLTGDKRYDPSDNRALAGNQFNANLYATGELQNRLALMIGHRFSGEWMSDGPRMFFYAGGRRLTDDPLRDFAAVSGDTWYDVELEKNGLLCTARFKESAGSAWTEWSYMLDSNDNFDINYVCIQTRLGYAGVDNVEALDSAYCGDLDTVYKQADLNQDCYVNLADTGIMASEWQNCTDPEGVNCHEYLVSTIWSEDFEGYTPPVLGSPWETSPQGAQIPLTGQALDGSGNPVSTDIEAIGNPNWQFSTAFRPITTENKVTAQLWIGEYNYSEVAIGMVGHKETDENHRAIAGTVTNANLYATGETQDRLALMIAGVNAGEYIPGGYSIIFLAGGKRLTIDPLRNSLVGITANTWYDVELEKNGLVCTARFKGSSDSTWTEWNYTLPADESFSVDYVAIQTRLYSAIDNINVIKTGPSTCGSPGTLYKRSDFNEDCYVNLLDIALIFSEWLDCTDPANSDCD